MNLEERYLFDLNGYLVIENVLTENEVSVANQAIDKNQNQIQIRTSDNTLDGGSQNLSGQHGRGELHGLLNLETPWSNPFREMIAHPKIIPISIRFWDVAFVWTTKPFYCRWRKVQSDLFFMVLPGRISTRISITFFRMVVCIMG